MIKIASRSIYGQISLSLRSSRACLLMTDWSCSSEQLELFDWPTKVVHSNDFQSVTCNITYLLPHAEVLRGERWGVSSMISLKAFPCLSAGSFSLNADKQGDNEGWKKVRLNKRIEQSGNKEAIGLLTGFYFLTFLFFCTAYLSFYCWPLSTHEDLPMLLFW